MIHEIALSIDEICDFIPNISDHELTRSILEMFNKYDLTYKVRTAYKAHPDDEEHLRIYCYIKKSKEMLIINSKHYKCGDFGIQMRITNPTLLKKVNEYPQNIREQIIQSIPCVNCLNCGKEYVFTYRGAEYRKCCMLCNNFTFHQFNDEDRETILRMIYDEICFAIPRQKRHLLDK